MKLDKQLIEFVGIVAVIASLTFVGMQLMLDRQVARADQYFNRTESRLATARAQLESDAYLDLMVTRWESGIRPAFMSEELEMRIPESYSSRNITTQILALQINALSWENLYFQYRQGMLPEELWLNSIEDLKLQIENPITLAVYRETSNNTEFFELLDQIRVKSISN